MQTKFPTGRNTGNSRNGKNTKKIITAQAPLEIKIPRDRTSSFEPKIIPKHKKRFDGFDNKIISMYA
ncbi:transposase, partial [bacterium]|nr:transposase [bacterium]